LILRREDFRNHITTSHTCHMWLIEVSFWRKMSRVFESFQRTWYTYKPSRMTLFDRNVYLCLLTRVSHFFVTASSIFTTRYYELGWLVPGREEQSSRTHERLRFCQQFLIQPWKINTGRETSVLVVRFRKSQRSHIELMKNRLTLS